MMCDHCGRTHYALFDADETFLDYAKAEHEEDPEGHILDYEYSAIYALEINGLMFVEDCPCNGLRLYEDLIWTENESITLYISRRKEVERINKERDRITDILRGTL